MSGLRSALVAGLAVAFLDGWIGALSGIVSMRFLLWSAAATLVACLPALLLAAFIPVPRSILASAAKRRALRVALLTFVVATVLLWQLRGAPAVDSRTGLLETMLVLAMGGFLATASFRAHRFTLAHPGRERRATALSLALPFVLAASCASVWLWAHHVESLRSWPAAGIGVAYLVVVGATPWLASRETVRRWSTAILAGVAVALAVTGLPSMRPETILREQPHNPRVVTSPIGKILLITIDTLRADSVSAIHSGRTATRRIDALARDGILFTQARAPSPWTLPSVAALMTGLSPDVLEVSRTTSRLRDHPTLAQILRDNGYLTAAIGKNPILRPQVGLDRGFSEYHFYPRHAAPGSSLGAQILRAVNPGRFGYRTRTTSQLTDTAIEWIELHRERDFFLWLHYLDPHTPYAPPAGYVLGSPPSKKIGTSFNQSHRIRNGGLAFDEAERDWLRALYDGEVRHVDDNLGRLFDRLAELELYDESLIVLTSDHGEEFWDHGGYEHGHSLYDELLRVPLIVKLPGSTVRRKISAPVSTTALFSTLLDSCGIGGEAPANDSLVPLWTGESLESHLPPVIGSSVLYYDDRISVVSDGFKYIRNLVTGDERLFDLDADPGETRSLSAEELVRLQAAREIVQRHHELSARMRERLDLGEAENLVLDEKTRDLLRSLGYVN